MSDMPRVPRCRSVECIHDNGLRTAIRHRGTLAVLCASSCVSLALERCTVVNFPTSPRPHLTPICLQTCRILALTTPDPQRDFRLAPYRPILAVSIWSFMHPITSSPGSAGDNARVTGCIFSRYSVTIIRRSIGQSVLCRGRESRCLDYFAIQISTLRGYIDANLTELLHGVWACFDFARDDLRCVG
ncbi:hypothetical protein CC86DRAFT_183901 [Ophiobolus disseminans]|uniref:Uncharacterized protein n=1 Tax=Ophiobolus disseminans TaxID=1469910 RepID=A0A6A7A729_9PLEO|nr:hypothetical protein CC86DRAFT_183901 [Ophiobolus disseminans]